MAFQIKFNNQTYKLGYTVQDYTVVNNGGSYSVVPTIDLTSYLKIQNVKAGTGISVSPSLTGVTISSTGGGGTITGATNGLQLYGKNVGLSTAYSASTLTNINSRLLTTSFNTYTGTTISNQILSGTSTPFILDNQANTNVFSYKTNVDIKGKGQVHLINGSSAISGISTNFTDATTGTGFGYWFQLYIKDSANNWYKIYVASIADNTHATINLHQNRADIRSGYVTNRGTNFAGVTGTYDYYIIRNWSDGLFSLSLGNSSYADNYGMAFGGSTVATGQGAIAMGLLASATNTQSFAIGNTVRSTGAQAFAGGKGNAVTNQKSPLAAGQTSFAFYEADASQTSGHGALAANSAILGGLNHNIPSNSNRSAILGGNAIKALSAVTDMVYLPKVSVGMGTGGSLSTANANQNLIARNSSTGALEITNGAGILTGNTTDIKIATVGKGFYIKEGTNATQGIRTLTGGTAVVSTSKVTAISRIHLTSQGGGANHGAHYISARSAGASFTITSTNASDTDVIAWVILEPA